MSKTEVNYGNKMYHLDNENDVKNLVKTVFEEIENSTTLIELNQIEFLFSKKNRMNIVVYPKIEFKILPYEINDLIGSVIDSDLEIDLKSNKTIIEKLTPLEKLLYSIIWKNGDLKKIKHIVQGIQNVNSTNYNKEDALVFFQFGKYLTKEKGQPIVDQHVLRAFAISGRMKKTDRINYSTPQWQKMHLINKTNKFLIDDYKEWLNSENIKKSLKQEQDYSYHIDKILFALGKTIKYK